MLNTSEDNDSYINLCTLLGVELKCTFITVAYYIIFSMAGSMV